MKSWAINVLLVLSVGTAIFFFNVKFSAISDADRVVAALDGINKHLQLGSRIVYKCDVPGADEFPAYVTYGIVPAKLKHPEQAASDTMLLLEPASITDTAVIALLSRSTVMWQKKDDKYNYLLIHYK